MVGLSPIAITGPSKNNKLYIADQNGIILEYDPSTKEQILFFDLRPNIINLNSNHDERGLLDITLNPSCDRMFIYYTANDNHNCLASIDMKTRVLTNLIRITEKATVNNGGNLAFGPDQYLYVAIGDGKLFADTRTQSLSTFCGKILRIDVSDKDKYKVPSDNPFVNIIGIRPEIYAYGFRTPSSIVFDYGRDICYVTDRGYKNREKVNILVKGGNYDCSSKDDFQFFHPGKRTKQFIEPMYEYQNYHSLGIIGCYPLKDGSCICIDRSGTLMKVVPGIGLIDISRLEGHSIRSSGRDNLGNIYLMTIDNLNRNSKIILLRL